MRTVGQIRGQPVRSIADTEIFISASSDSQNKTILTRAANDPLVFIITEKAYKGLLLVESADQRFHI